MIKIVCECGNECIFDEYDEKGNKHHYTEGEGRYTTPDINKFRFWQMHDVVGIVCEKCGKDIWLFT